MPNPFFNFIASLKGPEEALIAMGFKQNGRKDYWLDRIVEFSQFAIQLPEGETIINHLLNSLLSEPDRWNTDLSETNIFGDTREYEPVELAKRLWLRRNSATVCGHVSQVYEDKDAHTFNLLDGTLQEVCEKCIPHLRLYTIEQYYATEYGKTHPVKFTADWVYAGSMTDLRLDLEKIKH